MAAEKSKNIFENSLEGTMGARIRDLLRHTGLSPSAFEEQYGLGNGTLKSWKDESTEKSTGTIRNFLSENQINKEWWKTGKGEIFNTSVQNQPAVKGNATPKDLLIVLQDILAEQSDYRIIPKTVLDGEYRLLPKSEIEHRAKELESRLKELDDIREERRQTIEAKNKLIKRLEDEIAELRGARNSVAPQSAQ